MRKVARLSIALIGLITMLGPWWLSIFGIADGSDYDWLFIVGLLIIFAA